MQAVLAGIPRPRRAAVAGASSYALLLLLATAVLLFLPRAAPPAPVLGSSSSAGAAAAIRLDLRVARRSGNKVLWQLPSGPPQAALFMTPGCTIRATDSFDASPGCSTCVGLPEERRFARAVLDRGYIVLAISSRAECWSLNAADGGGGGGGSELTAVESIIKWWVEEQHPELQGLPLIGIDASSGRFFLSALAARVRSSSVAIIIAEGVFAAMKEVPTGYPPVLFVHMPKDADREREVAASMGKLREKHVDVREIQCDGFTVSAEFLAARIPGLTRAVADVSLMFATSVAEVAVHVSTKQP